MTTLLAAGTVVILTNKRRAVLLPDEIFYNILIHADPKALGNLCDTNKRMAAICRDETLWRNKIAQDYPGVPLPKDVKPRDYYKELTSLGRDVTVRIYSYGLNKTLDFTIRRDTPDATIVSDIIAAVKKGKYYPDTEIYAFGKTYPYHITPETRGWEAAYDDGAHELYAIRTSTPIVGFVRVKVYDQKKRKLEKAYIEIVSRDTIYQLLLALAGLSCPAIKVSIPILDVTDANLSIIGDKDKFQIIFPTLPKMIYSNLSVILDSKGLKPNAQGFYPIIEGTVHWLLPEEMIHPEEEEED